MAYSELASLALPALLCSFQLRSLSTITPRNLVDSVCSITGSSINNTISGFDGLFDLCE